MEKEAERDGGAEVKHTPGPWRLDFNGGSMRVLAVGGQESVVAQGLGDASIPEYLADARLVAAAPDMLEALRNCVSAMSADGSSGDDVADMLAYADAIKAGAAAIAKAEGRDK